MESYKTDKQLYREYLNDNMEAFKELVIRHKNNIIYFISRYTKNVDIAEDISQDVFMYLLLNKKAYNPKFSLKTFLYTIAKTRAINYLKKESKIVNIEDYDSLYIEDKDLEESIFKRDTQNYVRKVINKMKPDYQAIIYLADFERLSYKDVAKVMNKTNGQTKTLLYNARQKLKEMLSKEGFVYEEQ
ncbi:MAG: RNA polymerase sigma factor [Clostridia bacterium]|nr:RNA polymerase sigma factor [Clostridia bacterium]